jgi:hypothetical protein
MSILADYLRGCVLAPERALSIGRRENAAHFGGMAIACYVSEDEECAGLAARAAWREASLAKGQQRSVWDGDVWRGVWNE